MGPSQKWVEVRKKSEKSKVTFEIKLRKGGGKNILPSSQ